jgi:hypothetical protein
MATAKQESKKKLDSTKLIRLVRDCTALKGTARHVALTLATSADWNTFECRPSWACLMHWTGINRDALNRALKRIVETGIITKERRRKNSSIFRFDIKRLEELRVPYKSPEPETDGPEEFPCSQCGQATVIVEGMRCDACRVADSDPNMEPQAESGSAFEIIED